MKSRGRFGYFEKLGVGTTPKNLETIFSDDQEVLERLRIFLQNYEVPKNSRKRIWMHILMEWKYKDNASFLMQNCKLRFEDIKRAALVTKLFVPNPSVKRKNRRTEELYCVFKSHLVLCPEKGAVFGSSAEELQAILGVLCSVFEDDCLAYFTFKKLALLFCTRSTITLCCQKTMEIIRKRSNHVTAFVNEVESCVRNWFRSLFLTVFESDKVLVLYDRWFGTDEADSTTYLCCIAVALLETYVKEDWKDLSLLNVSHAIPSEIRKIADEVLDFVEGKTKPKV